MTFVPTFVTASVALAFFLFFFFWAPLPQAVLVYVYVCVFLTLLTCVWKGNKCGCFHCHSIYATASLGNASCLSACCCVSLFFIVYYSFIIIATVRFCLFFLPLCGCHYFCSGAAN